MESGLPMLNCLLQHTLRSFCTSTLDSSDSSSKWVYAVFWRILPRNYPPPKWDGGSILERAKGNKRNWILVWEDGFCDFYMCEREGSRYTKGRFGADVFFKLSHEVYNYGEGLVGKVAADNSHKWVYRDGPSENDPSFISASWNVSIDPQPRAWEVQFSSGIQTIAIISVRDGLIQLGSFDKVMEDLNLVISIQRKFSYLQSIPGIYAIQRPCFSVQQYRPYTTFNPPNNNEVPAAFAVEEDDKRHIIGSKRLSSIDGGSRLDKGSIKSFNFGYNSPQNGSPPFWHIPPLLPSIPSSFGALLANVPPLSYNQHNAIHNCGGGGHSGNRNHQVETGDQKVVESSRVQELGQDEKPISLHPNGLRLQDEGLVMELGFGGPMREAESALNLN